MKTIGKLALSGLAAVLPVGLTVYVLWATGAWLEAAFGGLLRRFVPGWPALPGAGLLPAFGLLVLLGLLMRAVFARRIAAALDRLADRIPLVRTVYGSVRDLLSLFAARTGEQVDQVVLVALPGTPFRVLGLVTRPEVPGAVAGAEGVAAVYLPMSYGIGGYTLLVPRADLTPVRMSVEDALRFAVTAGAPSKEP